MKILLVGASGFIGSELALALLRAGHDVTGVGRDLDYGARLLPGIAWVYADLRQMRVAADWAPIIGDADLVINASGVLQTGLRDDVAQVQFTAISALSAAAQQAGAGHFIQISAAGADQQPDSVFMASKAKADLVLRQSGMGHTILRPGLVIGRNGFGGSELLRAAAGMPLFHLNVTGTGPICCIAMSDLVDAVLAILKAPADHVGTFDMVEQQGRPLSHVIAMHRGWLGFAQPRWQVDLPVWSLAGARWAADALGWLGWRSPLRSNALGALICGVQGNARQTARLLGQEPLDLPQMLQGLGLAGKADRWHSRLALAYPVALAMLIVLWLAGGVVGLMRLDSAASLLIEAGFGEPVSRGVVIAGSVADVLIGLGIIFRPSLSLALKAGMAVAVSYIAGSAVWAPQLWLDPLGPMVKVLPVLALSLLCLAMARER